MMTEEAASPGQPDTGASATPATPAASAAAPTPATATPNPVDAPPSTDARTAALDPAKPAVDPAAPPVDPNAPVFKIPDEFKDKPWASKIKSEADLYKQLENLQGLVGKKTVIPDLAKATAEEKEAFYAQTRPASLDDYKFHDSAPAEFKEAVGASLSKHGITAEQANGVLADYAAVEQAQLQALYDPKGMTAELTKQMGEGYDPVPMTKILKTNLPAEVYADINKLPNAQLAVVHKAMAKLVADYGIVEKGAAHTEAGRGSTQPQDITAVRAGLRSEIANLGKKPHTAEEKQILIDKLNDTYTNQTKRA